LAKAGVENARGFSEKEDFVSAYVVDSEIALAGDN